MTEIPQESPLTVSFSADDAQINGRFYPSQRDKAHATVLLIAEQHDTEDGPLRLGFWLPLAGYHLLTVPVQHGSGAAALVALGRGIDLPPDTPPIDPARLVLGGWGAGGAQALAETAVSPTPLPTFVIAPQDANLDLAPQLANSPLLLLGGWHDLQTPVETQLLPFYRALQQTAAQAVTLHVLPTDHVFSGRQFTLAKTIWEWMQQALPAADAPGRDAAVSLREITGETARAIMNLKVTDEQRQFVASNEISIAQAYFQRDHAWFRAIYADETPVGFLMLYDNPEEPTYFLWRFMVDVRYQGMGYGRTAVNLLIDHVKTRPNATELLVSCVPGSGSPCPFYERLGFVYTGEKEGIELVMKLPLAAK